jgi:hypothetical protein
VYSHNVHGLRDAAKLEHIPRIMKNNNLDAYSIKETHLAGDFKKYLIFDYYLIHYSPETQPANGAKGGVANILSPELNENPVENPRNASEEAYLLLKLQDS